MHENAQFVSYLITGAVLVLVVLLRLRRTGQLRPLSLERLWVLPAIYLLIVIVMLVETPPGENGLVWGIGALLVGGLIGWYRGKTIAITVDPATHALNQRTSPASIIFLVALIAVRFGLRTVLVQEASISRLSPATVIDAFVLLALGLLSVQRLEMFLRGRRLLRLARAGAAPPR